MNLRTTVSGPFNGLAFVLEIGTVSSKKKKELQNIIEKHGGSIEFVITKKTTHVVTTPQLLDSYKIKSAVKHGCFVVTEDFLTETAKANTRIDEWPYLYIESQRASVYGLSSESFVLQHLREGYNNVFGLITALAYNNPATLLSEATTNIAALCISLGADLHSRTIHLKGLASSMHSHISIRKEDRIAVPTQQQIVKPPVLQNRATLTGHYTTASPRYTPLSKPVSPSLQSPYLSSSTQVASSTRVTPTPSPRITATSSPHKTALTATANKGGSTIRPSPTAALQEQKKLEEKQRKEKQAEDRRAQLDEAKAVLRERQTKRQAEEDERKRARDAEREELLERRKKEEEERKQRAAQIREAREKKINEERKKREEKLQQLQQKPATHFSDYFKKVDYEEEKRRIEEEWNEFQQQMEREKRKEEEEERKRVAEAERRHAEKEAKRLKREEEDAIARAEKQQGKAERRDQYEKNRIIAEARKKKQEEERKAKSIRDFQEREKKRALKAKLGVTVLPVEQEDYDKSKIFIGGIKLDDLVPGKLGKKYFSVRDARVNNLLEIFDTFGKVISRKVFLEKNHCFIVYAKPPQAKKALETMQKFEERKAAVEKIQAALKESKGNPLAAPHASFYVREPNVKKKKPTSSQEEPAEKEVS